MRAVPQLLNHSADPRLGNTTGLAGMVRSGEELEGLGSGAGVNKIHCHLREAKDLWILSAIWAREMNAGPFPL